MPSTILVVGSSNTDMVIKSDRLPAPGETVLGGEFIMNAGGKGANQAVAAARLNGDVVFIAKIGDDVFGRASLESFRKEGLDTQHVIIDKEAASGVALILVDNEGENSISVASGANARLSVSDLTTVESVLKSASVVLMQLEIPISTVEYVAALAQDLSIPVILNPAPAARLAPELLANLSILIPNRKEAELLSGIAIHDRASALVAAEHLQRSGCETVIITLGAEGVVYRNAETQGYVPAVKVKAIDTTAAGDVFCAAFAVAMAEGSNIKSCIEFASSAAAISVTRMGAQAAAPYRRELGEIMVQS